MTGATHTGRQLSDHNTVIRLWVANFSVAKHICPTALHVRRRRSQGKAQIADQHRLARLVQGQDTPRPPMDGRSGFVLW